MRKENLDMAIQGLKDNFLLLVSSIALLCLFAEPSLSYLCGSLFVCLLIIIAVLSGQMGKQHFVDNRVGKYAEILTILIEVAGFRGFYRTWACSRKVAALAGVLHLPIHVFLLGIGLLGCVLGFYALYTFLIWCADRIMLLGAYLDKQKKDTIAHDLKRNWYFPFSVAAFACLEFRISPEFGAGLLIAFVIAFVIAALVPDMWDQVNTDSRGLRIISILTTVGICLRGRSYCYGNLVSIPGVSTLLDTFSAAENVMVVISVFIAAMASIFVYGWVVLVWKKIYGVFKEVVSAAGFRPFELIMYSVMLILSLGFVTVVFSSTHAFYGAKYDVIYTSDSPDLGIRGAYLSLTNAENDLRQPLFALFSIPFMGIPYLVGQVVYAPVPLQALLMGLVQAIMLFLANVLLTQSMRLTPVYRACFMLLMYCTYTNWLFEVMMDQYVIAYFWLCVLIYLICREKGLDHIILWGAGGTLLTSLAFVPFLSENPPIKRFKEWCLDTIKNGMGFVVALLLFCRFDVIYNLSSKISSLRGFAGENVPWAEKFCQYTVFIRSVFFAPEAGVINDTSWRLFPPSGIDLLGAILLVLAIASMVLNKEKKAGRMAAGWVVYSMVILLIVGWGTRENGLNLYALYFGWAFLIMLFQLLEKIGDRWKFKFLVPVVSISGALIMARVNIPALKGLIDFAISRYPL